MHKIYLLKRLERTPKGTFEEKKPLIYIVKNYVKNKALSRFKTDTEFDNHICKLFTISESLYPLTTIQYVSDIFHMVTDAELCEQHLNCSGYTLHPRRLFDVTNAIEIDHNGTVKNILPNHFIDRINKGALCRK